MGKNWPWLMEMHLFYYNSFTTEKLLNKAGFKIIGLKTYVHYVSVDYLLRKVIAILPNWLGKILNIFRHLNVANKKLNELATLLKENISVDVKRNPMGKQDTKYMNKVYRNYMKKINEEYKAMNKN